MDFKKRKTPIMASQKVMNASSTDDFDEDNLSVNGDESDVELDDVGEYDKDDILFSKPEEEIIQMKVSKRMRDLSEFLRGNNFLTEKGDQNTNIINLAEKRTYNIPPSYIEEFFTIVDDCRKEKRALHFLERQESSSYSKSGIMIDFDCYQRSKEPQIKPEHFLRLTKKIANLLKSFIDFTPYATKGKFSFKVFIIRKPAVVFAPVRAGAKENATTYKDGFHILIPEIQVLKGLKVHLLNEMTRLKMITQIFKDTDKIIDPETMLDKGSTRNPVHFFGHSKVDKPAYILSNAYEATLYVDDDDEEALITSLDLTDINKGILKNGNNSTPINLTYELSLAFYLESIGDHPTWLKKQQFDYRQSLETKIQLMVEKTAKGIFTEDELAEDDNDIDMLAIADAQLKHLRDLLSILDKSYTDEYEKWRKVICAIAHTGRTEKYKKLARWFSKRRPEQWNEAEFERQWNEIVAGRFHGRPVTKNSIIHWAKTSSPQRFDEINSENYIRMLAKYAYDNEGRIEHAMAARILHTMVGHKFIVDVDFSDKAKRAYAWYEFVLPGQAMKKGEVFKWRREMNPDNVHMFISDELPKVYREVVQKIKDRKDAADNENLAKYYGGIEKAFKKSQSSLSNDTFQNGVIRQAEYKFRQRGFFDELDSYEDVIGVGNGVLKIGRKTELIKGFHEYKISMYTDTDYIHYNPLCEYVQTLLKAFRDIFPEDDVFNFMMMYGSTWLDGKESACIMVFLVGGGQNGKTFFSKMLQNALGMMYVKPLKMSLITGPSERAENANSALMDVKGIHGGYMDEAGKIPVINVERFKSLVNPGLQSTRQLHGKQDRFKVTANLIALANYDFVFDTTDHGTWRRVYYYKNKVKFCAKPDPNNPFEKKEDRRFIYDYVNDPAYKQAMLSILTHFYERLCNEYNGDITKVPCPTIVKETETFRNKQDAVNRFITQMIVKSPTAEPLSLTQVASKYQEWYNKNVRRCDMSLDAISSQFENSKITKDLEMRLNGMKYLIGHRIKSSPEEPLGDGEEELAVSTPSTQQDLNEEVTPVITPVADDLPNDTFIDTLTRNAPTVVQLRDNIEDQNIDLDALLDEMNL